MTIIINEIKYKISDDINNILDALYYIKTNIDSSLTYSFGCKSGVCGSCAIRVNGIETLACCNNIKDNDEMLPLKNLPIIKGLIVDNSNIKKKLIQANANLETLSHSKITHDSVDKIDLQSNCILCNSCYSACPIYEVNENFIGPFALTRVYRYSYDAKENNSKSKLDAIQNDGIWDCTLCGACDAVCPSNITIKNDIMSLQNLSVQNGYENPAFSSDTSFDSFGTQDFGFDPNSF